METVLLYILGIVIVVIGIAVSIALHELGHLIPAKSFGVKVGQYMIGFGRTIWSRKRGETEYGLKMIPLGGYISMAGMYPPIEKGGSGRGRTAGTGIFDSLVQDARDASAETVQPGEEERTFYRLPVWKRVIVMLGGPFMNLLIAIVLIGVVLVGFGVPQASTTIGSVNECMLPATSERQECDSSDPEGPAAAAGILPGDNIVSIEGTQIDSWEQATGFIRESPGESLDFVVERDGERREFEVTPMLTERYVADGAGAAVEGPDGELLTEEVGMLGITSQFMNTQQPVTAVLPAVGDNIVRVAGVILNIGPQLVAVAEAAFGPGERDPEGPIGLVGVGRIAGEISSIETIPMADRVSSLIGLLASLNVALFVFNLVPLMPLDGGHIAVALWDGLRHRLATLFGRKDPGPVDAAKLVPLTLTVAVLLGGMTLLLLYADIVKPISLL